MSPPGLHLSEPAGPAPRAFALIVLLMEVARPLCDLELNSQGSSARRDLSEPREQDLISSYSMH